MLSMGGVSGRTIFPSRADWDLAPVAASGIKLPLLSPPAWDGGAIESVKYLGRNLRVARSDRLRADGLYEERGAKDGLGFPERLAALVREARLETVGMPAVVAVKWVGERLGALSRLVRAAPPKPDGPSSRKFGMIVIPSFSCPILESMESDFCETADLYLFTLKNVKTYF